MHLASQNSWQHSLDSKLLRSWAPHLKQLTVLPQSYSMPGLCPFLEAGENTDQPGSSYIVIGRIASGNLTGQYMKAFGTQRLSSQDPTGRTQQGLHHCTARPGSACTITGSCFDTLGPGGKFSPNVKNLPMRCLHAVAENGRPSRGVHRLYRLQAPTSALMIVHAARRSACKVELAACSLIIY